MKRSKVEYVGKDLESMDFAENYHKWILDVFRPFLGESIVEVGAGTGSLSRLLLAETPKKLSLVEPSAMFDTLKKEIDPQNYSTGIAFYNDIFANCAAGIVAGGPPDSIVYINVLEHIEDDAAELKLMHDSLAHGGRIFIFVPAIPFLLSAFDRHIGHFRRYTRSGLIAKCEHAGFRILLARGFDLLGILPWMVKYRMMGSLTMESGAVKLYDKAAVPFIKPLENLLKPLIGKNLIVVAEK